MYSANTFRDWVFDVEVIVANARMASTSRTRMPPFAITTELLSKKNMRRSSWYVTLCFFLFDFKVCLGVVIPPVCRINHTLGVSFQFGKWFFVFACPTSECYGEKDKKLICIESNQNCRDENKSNYVVAVHIEELLDLGQIKQNFPHWKAFTATIRSNVQYRFKVDLFKVHQPEYRRQKTTKRCCWQQPICVAITQSWQQKQTIPLEKKPRPIENLAAKHLF